MRAREKCWVGRSEQRRRGRVERNRPRVRKKHGVPICRGSGREGFLFFKVGQNKANFFRYLCRKEIRPMSDYIVSARKYRPTSFDSVVGQSALTTTLKNAIASGKLAHAYLFCGPRGVGKTTSARIFAKTINCLSPTPEGNACEQCESCVAFNEARSYNIHELDAASNNSVDDIRQLIEQVQIPPQVGRYKVFIIDEVHMLSQAAFNAFLKTLEEPPAHAIFILATTEKHKILPTILSRCQIYDFNRMEVADTVRHLMHVAQSEGIQYEEAALHVIARKADGGMRDALSIFDQVASFTGGNITYQQVIDNLNVLDYDYYFDITDQLLAQDIPAVLLTLNKILSRGFEGNHFMGGLASHLRDVLVSRDAQTLPLLEVAEAVRERYAQQAQRCTPQFLYAALRLCNECDMNYRTARNKRLLVELTLIQVAQLLASEEEAPSGGRRPARRLLPIFSPAAPVAEAAAPPRVATPAPSVASVASAAPAAVPAASTPTTPPAARPTAALPAAMAQRLQTVSLTRRTAPGMPSVQPAAATPRSTTNIPTPGERTWRTKNFDLDTLAYQWMRFANELPREHSAAAGRLKLIASETERFQFSPPVEGAEQAVPIQVLIENAPAAQLLNQLLPELTVHLRNTLQNDFVQVSFVVDTTQVIKKRAHSPREIYNEMLNKNAAFKELAIKLRLELA